MSAITNNQTVQDILNATKSMPAPSIDSSIQRIEELSKEIISEMNNGNNSDKINYLTVLRSAYISHVVSN